MSTLYFSKRKIITNMVVAWCKANGVGYSPLNIVSAMSILGFMDTENAVLVSDAYLSGQKELPMGITLDDIIDEDE